MTKPPLIIPDDYDWGDDDSPVVANSPLKPETTKSPNAKSPSDNDATKQDSFDDITGDRIGASCIASLCGG